MSTRSQAFATIDVSVTYGMYIKDRTAYHNCVFVADSKYFLQYQADLCDPSLILPILHDFHTRDYFHEIAQTDHGMGLLDRRARLVVYTGKDLVCYNPVSLQFHSPPVRIVTKN